MTGFSTLQGLLGTLFDRGAKLVDWRDGNKCDAAGLAKLCEDLLSSKGEATGVTLAARILARYGDLPPDQKDAFFALLAGDFDLDPSAVTEAAQAYRRKADAQRLQTLLEVTEPRRQALLRRLNQAPGGTAALVSMREDLLARLKHDPTLARIDVDFAHLFASWFNRGFLVMRPIDWRTPANILEKIIAYEAVHAIDSWDRLRSRLEPGDRRCFGFFHPSMPEDPLIFVEVALCRDIPADIESLLTEDRTIIPAKEATTAVFYSISNCQSGLKGVSFGNFLIKQVADDLGRALPNLSTFVTLSPVPGFTQWLSAKAKDDDKGAAAKILAATKGEDWIEKAGQDDALKALILGQAAAYLLTAKRPDGQPVDPVARFHLGNGARLERLNWPGDLSPRGISQAAGLMVNYRYDLANIENNHEAYAERREVIAARAVNGLLPNNKT